MHFAPSSTAGRFSKSIVRRLTRRSPSLQAIVAKCLALSPDDRYPDAEALEHDLDRFLEHQPLKFAKNSSRPEAPWATGWRDDADLIASAGALVVLGALMYLLSPAPSRKETFRPLVEKSLIFHSAVNHLEQGVPAAAYRELSSLPVQFPHSALPKLYACLALNNKDDLNLQSQAEEFMRKSLAEPDASSAIAAWAKLHPRVVDGLVSISRIP